MPTPLIFYAIDHSFRYNSFLWKTPIGWDGKTDRMTYDKAPHIKYFWWYFCVYGLFYGVSGASAFYTIYWQYYSPRKELNISHSIQYALLIPTGGLAAGIAMVVMAYRQHAVQIVDGILDFHEIMKVYETMGEKVPAVNGRWNEWLGSIDRAFRKARIPSIFLAGGDVDWAGLILFVALTALPIVSLITVLSAVFIFRVDVYRFPLEDMWSNLNIDYSSNLITLSVHTFLRLSLTFIAYMEGQRIFPFLVYFYALSGKLVITYIRIFAEYAQQVRNGDIPLTPNWITLYTHLAVLALQPEKQMATQAFFLMSSGLFFCAGLNFATIRFLDFGIPPLYYAIFPFFATLLIMIILSLLPVAIDVYEKSKNILQTWTHSIPGGRKANGWMRKKLKSMRPLRVYAGISGFYFYKLDATVFTTYCMSIQDWTLNLLMTFHPSAEKINAIANRLQ
ncbi:hypothetical protein Fcan01_15625 [Folsomia candida]|uniref:Uncharacterized protein n=1 Tax=Folsomia candida TaxID=158441 RepID=A0A226DVR0_FOLCA|nr:hypothetical protein Fcan01_15625 [Folsomia candida]